MQKIRNTRLTKKRKTKEKMFPLFPLPGTGLASHTCGSHRLHRLHRGTGPPGAHPHECGSPIGSIEEAGRRLGAGWEAWLCRNKEVRALDSKLHENKKSMKHQWKSMKNQWKHWKSMKINWKSMNNQWKTMKINENQWLGWTEIPAVQFLLVL